MTRTATRKGMTLRDALAEFIKHPTPWMLLAWSSALIIGRITLGSWSIDPVHSDQ
ncbi:Probable fatty acid hydroxylase [Mycobacteroides abscessus subsp. abscessus]|nr:Probable fatty acid hydroxylase [Mycobacteroides abscessus subsp. abscessus]